MLTGEQLRAARAMLKLEQGELAELSEVSVETIKRLERMEGPIAAHSMTLHSLQTALERQGAIFLPENGGLPGVRLRRDPPPEIRIRKRRGDAPYPVSRPMKLYDSDAERRAAQGDEEAKRILDEGQGLIRRPKDGEPDPEPK